MRYARLYLTRKPNQPADQGAELNVNTAGCREYDEIRIRAVSTPRRSIAGLSREYSTEQRGISKRTMHYIYCHPEAVNFSRPFFICFLSHLILNQLQENIVLNFQDIILFIHIDAQQESFTFSKYQFYKFKRKYIFNLRLLYFDLQKYNPIF